MRCCTWLIATRFSFRDDILVSVPFKWCRSTADQFSGTLNGAIKSVGKRIFPQYPADSAECSVSFHAETETAPPRSSLYLVETCNFCMLKALIVRTGFFPTSRGFVSTLRNQNFPTIFHVWGTCFLHIAVNISFSRVELSLGIYKCLCPPRFVVIDYLQLSLSLAPSTLHSFPDQLIDPYTFSPWLLLISSRLS